MNKEKHSKEVVEIANTIVNECGNAPCKECMWCDAATWAHAEALYNAGYRKQEWISVEERLPELDGEYLTWNGLIYYLIRFNASLGLWNVSEDGDTSTAIRGVTHWMPLPEAPKVKGGAE